MTLLLLLEQFGMEIEFEEMDVATVVNGLQEVQNAVISKIPLYVHWNTQMSDYCDHLLKDRSAMTYLANQNFDMILADSLERCSYVLRDYLNISIIYYQNYGFDGDSGSFYPYMPSWMCNPDFGICESDQMTFSQRLKTAVFVFIHDIYIRPHINSLYDNLRQKHNIGTDGRTIDGVKRGITIANIDFNLDFPRPIMPHVKPISYMFVKQPSPLPEFYNNLLERSSDHGVILLSFGSVYLSIGEEKSNIFARVFARLPQTVIWKFSGEPPKDLGENTHLVDWFPQADLLAHPKTRLFITHCGQSSTYEAAYNAVPVVAIPLFFDQPYNAAKLVLKNRVGVMLDFSNLTEQNLEMSIEEVLSNKEYKLNANSLQQKLSHNLVHPKDEFLYWVNYTLTHKTVEHLISNPAHKLSWYQYLLFDVVGLVLVVLFVSLFFIYKLASTVLHYFCKYTKRHAKDKRD